MIYNTVRSCIRAILRSSKYDIRVKLPDGKLECIRFVLPHLLSQTSNARLVQIGACDGDVGDPISDSIRHPNVTALLVEPMETPFALLKKRHEGSKNVILEQAAIGLKDGLSTMYRLKRSDKTSDEEHAKLLQVSSFSKAHIISHGFAESQIEEVQVPSFTLKTLLERHGFERVDVLQIDAEGFDAELVEAALKLPELPTCINFEHLHLKMPARVELYEKLSSSGYLWLNDYMNTCAVLKGTV